MRAFFLPRSLSIALTIALLLPLGTALHIVESVHASPAQCSDGIDNDRDGGVDYPGDFGCSSASDNDETYPKAECQDGYDNDRDGYTDNADAGCLNTQDNDESSAAGPTQCRDGVDNDGDGSVDFPNDFSCSSADDTDENWPRAKCYDGYDNDGDRLIDYPEDPGCSGLQDNDEQIYSTALPQCRDGIDNDGDGAVDFPNDISCPSPDAFDERYPVLACQDGFDNDRNGKTDYPNDPGCTSSQDPVEDHTNIRVTQCNDGVDNDGDGAFDFPYDFSCHSLEDADEDNPKAMCQDGTDNDGDGYKDYPEDPGCISTQDNDEGNTLSEAQCRDGIDNDGDGGVDFPGDLGCTSGDDPSESTSKAMCQDGTDNDNDGRTDYPQDAGCSSPQDNNEKNAGAVTLDVTANPDPVLPGQEVLFSLVLRNNSSTPMSELRVQQNLPTELSFLSGSDGGYNRYDGIVLWSRVSVPPYTTKTLTMRALVDAAVGNGKRFRSLIYVNGEVLGDVTSVVRTGSISPSAYGPDMADAGDYYGSTPVFGPNYGNVNGSDSTSAGYAYQPGQQLLPKTGIGDFTGALENTRRFLSPLSGSSASPIATLFWILLISGGLATGAVLGKRASL